MKGEPIPEELFDAGERMSPEELSDHQLTCLRRTPDQRTAAVAAIALGVKDGVGVSVQVEIVDPETLERSVGKIRRLVDERSV